MGACYLCIQPVLGGGGYSLWNYGVYLEGLFVHWIFCGVAPQLHPLSFNRYDCLLHLNQAVEIQTLIFGPHQVPAFVRCSSSFCLKVHVFVFRAGRMCSPGFSAAFKGSVQDFSQPVFKWIQLLPVKANNFTPPFFGMDFQVPIHLPSLIHCFFWDLRSKIRLSAFFYFLCNLGACDFLNFLNFSGEALGKYPYLLCDLVNFPDWLFNMFPSSRGVSGTGKKMILGGGSRVTPSQVGNGGYKMRSFFPIIFPVIFFTLFLSGHHLCDLSTIIFILLGTLFMSHRSQWICPTTVINCARLESSFMPLSSRCFD